MYIYCKKKNRGSGGRRLRASIEDRSSANRFYSTSQPATSLKATGPKGRGALRLFTFLFKKFLYKKNVYIYIYFLCKNRRSWKRGGARPSLCKFGRSLLISIRGFSFPSPANQPLFLPNSSSSLCFVPSLLQRSSPYLLYNYYIIIIISGLVRPPPFFFLHVFTCKKKKDTETM